MFMVPMYMDTQPTLTTNMRAILVDWLVEVQENFELNHETLYLAVKLVDTYLSIKQVPKENLQLVGAASLFIACKFDVSCVKKRCMLLHTSIPVYIILFFKTIWENFDNWYRVVDSCSPLMWIFFNGDWEQSTWGLYVETKTYLNLMISMT